MSGPGVSLPSDFVARSWINLTRVCVYAVVTLLILSPPIKVTDSFSVRLEDAVVVWWLSMALARSSRATPRPRIYWSPRLSLLTMFACLIPLSILVGSLANEGSTLADLIQVGRVLSYVLIAAMTLTLISGSSTPDDEIAALFRWMLGCSIVLTVIMLQQHWNWFGLNQVYGPWVAPTQYLGLPGYAKSSGRPVGMIGNPNSLAFLLVILSMVCLRMMLVATKWVRYGVWFGVLLVLLVLTVSRTAVVAFVLGLGTMVALHLLRGDTIRRGSTRFRVLLPAALTIAAVGVVLLTQVGYTAAGYRLEDLGSISTSESYQERQSNWSENLELFRESPWVGFGPLSRREFRASADNEWLLLGRAYGVIGIGLLILAVVAPGSSVTQYRRRMVGGTETRWLVVGLLVAMAIHMWPASVFHSLELMPLVLIVLSTDDHRARPLLLA